MSFIERNKLSQSDVLAPLLQKIEDNLVQFRDRSLLLPPEAPSPINSTQELHPPLPESAMTSILKPKSQTSCQHVASNSSFNFIMSGNISHLEEEPLSNSFGTGIAS